MNTSSQNTIIVSDLEIVVEKRDIKNLHIGVYPPFGRIRIAAPMHLDNEAVRLAIISKLSWIKKRQKAFLNQPRQSPREMVTGESHYLFGKRYLLNIIYRYGKHEIVKKHSKLELYAKENTTIANRLQVLEEYYRDNLKCELETLVDKWQKNIGVELSGWKIQKMKTKWGSCNIEDKRVLFNLELAKVPRECIEYIVVHELLHLKERCHNNNFKMLLEEYMSDWQSRKEQLKLCKIGY